VTEFHPAIPFFIAAILIPFLHPMWRKVVQLGVPFIALLAIPSFLIHGTTVTKTFDLFGYTFTPIRLDALSMLFVLIFLIFAFLANLYSLHVTERRVHIFANIYIGSSLGAVLAGDLVTLFVFWEIMAVTSCILIWNRQRQQSLKALYRYLLVHLTGGLLFFTAILIKLLSGQSMAFNPLEFDLTGGLIFLSFLINAAVVPVHAWLPDSYPEGTPSSSIYLSCFTTKVAIYVLARGFAGAEILIWLGAITAVYGVVYALMENDMRRLLSYHIVCQIGYMICGIGIGTELGVAAGTAHAAGNILFKGLLFMATGALIHMTGKSKLSDLGGLAKVDKEVLLYYMIGGLAISGAPFLNGFVSKALLINAAAEAHMGWLELLLLVVAVGTFLSIVLKLAYFAFWNGPLSTLRPKKVPKNMHYAMAATSFLCILIGVFPQPFFHLLPFRVDAHVYTQAHVIHTLQLLLAAYLGFLFILKSLRTKAVLSLDTDWFYRKGARLFVDRLCQPIRTGQEWVQNYLTTLVCKLDQWMQGLPSQTIPPTARPLVYVVSAFILVGVAILALS